VFVDIGVPEPEEESAEAQLASRIREIIRSSRLTQVAAIMVGQPSFVIVEKDNSRTEPHDGQGRRCLNSFMHVRATRNGSAARHALSAMLRATHGCEQDPQRKLAGASELPGCVRGCRDPQ
jgi:hypothetical protein